MQVLKLVNAMLFAALFVGGVCSAQTKVTPDGKMDMGFYVGGSVGAAKADLSVPQPAGVTIDTLNKDDSNFAWKIFAGFPFYRGLAVELGYQKLGRLGYNLTTTPTGSLSETFRIMGYNADLVGKLPIRDGFSVLARFGGYYNDTSPVVAASGAVAASSVSASDRRWSVKAGLGVQYDATPSIAVRAEWEHFRKLGPYSLDLDMLSIGMVYQIQ